jgi:hypothetical protein
MMSRIYKQVHAHKLDEIGILDYSLKANSELNLAYINYKVPRETEKYVCNC